MEIFSLGIKLKMKSQTIQMWNNLIQPMVRRLGYDISRYPPEPPPHWSTSAFYKLRVYQDDTRSGELIPQEEFVLFCAQNAKASYSQLFQDLFVRWILNDPRDGYFVEFGATDGTRLSNTKHLEETLGWTGILAEPARVWHDALRKNRSCAIDTRCIWKRDRELVLFSEQNDAELSCIQAASANDMHAASRTSDRQYEVETAKLTTLLDDHDAPQVIDYLSIDTEGSEFDILQDFDYSSRTIKIITVEHNYTANREPIKQLLVSNGYRRVLSEISAWDDWYIHRSVDNSRSGSL